MVESFNIGLPALSGLTASEEKQDRQLRTDIAEAKAKREAAQAEWNLLMARYEREKKRHDSLDPYTPIQRAEAVTALANAHEARWKFFRIERDLLEIEVPLVERIIGEYVPLANRASTRAKAVANEYIELAKQAVRDEFLARYNPRVFPPDADGLESYVNQHPIVQHARAQALSAGSVNYSHSTREAATAALNRMAARLAGLQGSVKRASELFKDASVQRDEAKEQAEISIRQQKAAGDEQRKQDELARTEARKMLAKAMKINGGIDNG